MNAARLSSPSVFVWVVRVVWVGLAAAMALAISAAADDRGDAAGTVASITWWPVVAVIVVALVVPSALGLTALRLLVPATVPAAVVAIVLGGGVAGVVALALAVLAVAVTFAAETAEAFVQGSAYGQERRLPLRAPAAFAVPAVVAWLLWCALLLTAVLLLGTSSWVPGTPVALVAAAATAFLFVRLHRLSLRWLVLVPAGLVVHDPVVLAETLMVQRTNVRTARLAPADTEALDLTGPAAGHAVEVVLGEMALAVLAGTRAEPKGKALHVQSFLIAPARPGRALQAIAATNIAVG